MMQLTFLARIGRDRRGVAAVEFALWSTLLLMPLLAGLDFGIYTIHKLRLNSAVEQASMVAFQTRKTVDEAAVGGVVAAAWGGGPAVTTDVRCNGAETCVNAGRPCGCITGFAGGMPTFTGASCTATCANGVKPGYYMTIRATAGYAPIIGGVSVPATLDRTVTVSLQ